MGKKNKKKRRYNHDKMKDYSKNYKPGSSGSSYLNLPDGVERVSIDKEECKLSFVSYEVTVDNHPQDIEPGTLWHERVFAVHYGVGPEEVAHICPKEAKMGKCKTCEVRRRMEKDEEADEDVVKNMRPKFRQLFNLKRKDKIVVLEHSWYTFGESLQRAVNRESKYITYPDAVGGWLVLASFQKKKIGKNPFFDLDNVSFKKRKDVDDSIYDKAHNLDEMLIIPTYEETCKYFGEDDEGTDEDEEDDDGYDEDAINEDEDEEDEEGDDAPSDDDEEDDDDDDSDSDPDDDDDSDDASDDDGDGEEDDEDEEDDDGDGGDDIPDGCIECTKCDGAGENKKGKDCSKCDGDGYVKKEKKKGKKDKKGKKKSKK